LLALAKELRPLAHADPRVQLLVTIPGIGDLLGLTNASEIGEISRFSSARKLVGYSGLTPRVYQAGAEDADRQALEVRFDHAAVVGDRGRTASMAGEQPLA
jgi:transposase